MSRLWLDIFNRNIYAPPAAVRVKGPPPTDSYPFLVELRHVVLKKAATLLKGDVFPEVHYQLRAYLYDSQNKRFFGRPWRGRWVKGESDARQRIVFAQPLYFHIPYKDSNNLLAVELIRRRVQALQDEITTLGWGILRLIPSVARNDIPQAQMDMFRGSPQVMLILQSDPVESDPKLKRANIFLHYGLRSHPFLRKGYDFLPHNSIVGAEEPVPGLEPGDGGEIILQAPVAKLRSPAVIDHLILQLGPLAQRIESEVCDFMNKERLLKDNRLYDGEVMHILEHRIRVGVHNGWTYLHEPYIFHLSTSELAPDTRSLQRRTVATHRHARSSSWDMMSEAAVAGKGRLFLRNRIELNELVRDPGVGLVFCYQLLVALQGSKPNPPATVVTVAWGVWSPFGDNVDASSRPVVVTLPLRGGPTRNPDAVLCLTDFYSLSELAQRDRPTRPGKGNAITIEFQFNANPKRTEEAVPAVVDGVPAFPPHSAPVSPPSASGPSPTTSSRQPTPAPPSRTGRAPLPSAIKKPGMIFDPSAMQPMPYPFPPSFYWPPAAAHALMPMVAYPYMTTAPAGQMTELTIAGPIHAPILALQQEHWRPSGVPRNIMALLEQAKFQPVVDRHGEMPELVDIFDAAAFSLDADLKDPLICNEIVFQFMGLARPDARTQLPQFTFFTFYFYRFPLVTTERLLLSVPEQAAAPDPTVSLKILRRVDKTGQMAVGPPGFIVKFIVDPEYLKPGEHELFLEYLYDHQVCIDVWDGESLMLIGSCMLPLRQLCRRNQEAVQAYCQLPVVTTDNQRHLDHDEGSVTAIQPVMKALLYLKVACAGYPSAGGIDALLKLNVSKSTRNAAVITHALQRDTIGLDLGSVERLVVRPQPLAARGVIIRPFLVTAKKLQEISDDLPEDRRRKLQRLENIRQIEKYSAVKQNGKITKEAYIRDIQTLKNIREQTKERTIMTALFQSLTTVHPIFPTLGSCEFMEFLLNNPYNEPITANVDISDNELKLVTDVREWQYFKAVYNLLTPLDAGMFATTAPAKPGDKEVMQVYLKPRESVYVPLKYQTFQSIDYPEYKEGYQKPSMRLLLHSKNVKAVFRRVDNGDVVSALILQVEPQPHVVHQTFRFYHPENQFLAKYIRIQPQELWETARKVVEYAYCTDPTVICELRSTGTAGVAQDVFMKVAAGTSPRVKRFCVMLYGDPYLSTPIQIWQIYVHAMEKMDVSTVQGSGIRFPIVLKGDQASRLVRCFSSAPQETVLVPNAPFVLDPGAMVDVQVLFKPFSAGERMMQLSAVDVELREMIKSWLIFASVRPAVMTKAYQVIVHIGTAGRTLNKRVSYTNSYNVKKKFRLASSREDLMTIKHPPLLQLDAGATGVVGLRFNTNVQPQKTEILLFINDEQDKNEDTYGIEAVFLST